jgi:energy-coupling factor transport system ATP-binding protein
MAHRERLQAAEVAEAEVLGDVALVLALAGWLLPLGVVLFAAGSVPFAVLAVRRRPRAVVLAAIASGQVAFLLGGVNLETNLVLVALIGAVVGTAFRRGWRRPGTLALAIPVVWAPMATVSLAFLAVFSESRRLALAQLDIGSAWARRLARKAGYADIARAGDDAVAWAIHHWWIAVPLAELGLVCAMALLCRRVAVPALRRMDEAFDRPPPVGPRAVEAGAVDPVPVALAGVSVTYAGAPAPALDAVDLRIEPGTFVVVVGPNGSGKSTLARLLAGRAPTIGSVSRPGVAGLGREGGTAAVFQRPESQVLGVRAADDVRWGTLADDATVAAALDRVGLAGFEQRETSTLSGGELQRLALAAALVRRPALLIADEATAMVDPRGRREVVAVLRAIADDGVAVVLVTHHLDETATADRVIALERGRVTADGPPAVVA